jgi:hypothetical protein
LQLQVRWLGSIEAQAMLATHVVLSVCDAVHTFNALNACFSSNCALAEVCCIGFTVCRHAEVGSALLSQSCLSKDIKA